MQPLFDQILASIDNYLSGAGMFQVAVLLSIILAGIAVARSVRSSELLKRVQARESARDRGLEALLLTAPIVMGLLVCGAVSGFMHAARIRPALLDACLPLIGLLLLVRLAVYLFRVSVGNRAPIKGWGNTITLII